MITWKNDGEYLGRNSNTGGTSGTCLRGRQMTYTKPIKSVNKDWEGYLKRGN